MKKMTSVIVLMLMCIVMLGVGSQKQEEMVELPIDIEFSYYADYWNVYDFTETPFATQEDFEQQVEMYIIQICNLLGFEEFWDEINEDTEYMYIQVGFKNAENSYANYLSRFGDKGVRGKLELNWSIMNRDGALTHELTHVIAGETFSISLQEGVCQYVQERIGNSSAVAFYKDLGIEFEEQELLRLAYESSINRLLAAGLLKSEDINLIWEKIGREGYYAYVVGTYESMLWYKLSHSFTSWMIERYGMEQTIALMENGVGDDSYKDYIGKSLEELKQEWMDWFLSIEPKMTIEEFEAIGKTFMKSA